MCLYVYVVYNYLCLFVMVYVFGICMKDSFKFKYLLGLIVLLFCFGIYYMLINIDDFI